MHWLLNRYVIGAAAIALAVVAAFSFGYRVGKGVVQSAWDKERAAAAVELATAREQVRTVERTMNDAAAKYQRDKYDSIRALNDRHRALVDSLRERASRPAAGAVSSPAGDAPIACQCTGEGLHREDAEFLAGEAARGDELRAELLACYQQYDAARAAVNRK